MLKSRAHKKAGLKSPFVLLSYVRGSLDDSLTYFGYGVDCDL